MAAQIEAPPRVSIRSVYEASGPFYKWCLSNHVDFRAPPIKSIADFPLYLFQDRKLQPSTIDGYRSAIADKVGNSPINVRKMRISLVSWIASTETDPSVRGASLSWNLSLVLHQLTKVPFEPPKVASWKQLAFKAVFLLALGSDKHRSEVHA